MRNRILFILKCGLGLGLLAFLLYKINLMQSVRLLTEARPRYLVLALVCLLAGQLLQVSRWKVILEASGFHLAFARLLAINLVGMFFSNFLPSSVGGDLFKAFYVADSRKYGQVISTTLLSRFIGMIATFLFGLLSMRFASEALKQQPWWPSCGVALTMAAALSVALLAPGVERRVVNLLHWIRVPDRYVHRVSNLLDPLRAWRRQWQTVLLTLVLALLFLVIGFSLVVYFCSLSLNIVLPLPSVAMIAAIASIAFALPITFNGIGVAEGVYVYLFMTLGVSAEKALLLALLFRALLAAQALLGGVIYFFLKRSRDI